MSVQRTERLKSNQTTNPDNHHENHIRTLCVPSRGGLTLKAADKADKPRADPEAVFKKLDTNGDGKLTKAEYMASPGAKKDAAKAEERWKAISKGKEGSRWMSIRRAQAGERPPSNSFTRHTGSNESSRNCPAQVRLLFAAETGRSKRKLPAVNFMS